MVGAEGFEPPTLCSQSRCATRLRYAPTVLLDCIVNRIQTALALPHVDQLQCCEASARLEAGLGWTDSMLQLKGRMAAIVQWQNACLWHRMSRVRSPLAAPTHRDR